MRLSGSAPQVHVTGFLVFWGNKVKKPQLQADNHSPADGLFNHDSNDACIAGANLTPLVGVCGLQALLLVSPPFSFLIFGLRTSNSKNPLHLFVPDWLFQKGVVLQKYSRFCNFFGFILRCVLVLSTRLVTIFSKRRRNLKKNNHPL